MPLLKLNPIQSYLAPQMVGQYLREMEEQLAKAQKAVADQLFLEKKYEMLVAETQAIIEKRVRQANLAVDRNKDEIAKLALQDKIVQEQKQVKLLPLLSSLVSMPFCSLRQSSNWSN